MGKNWPLVKGREGRKAARRAAIIAIAGPRFLKQGYYGTTMSAISAEMGGSKGTLWSYFASKEALFAACVETAITAFRKDLVATLDRNLDIHKALLTFAALYIEGLCRPEAIALQRLITSEGPQFPELSAIFYKQGPEATVSLLEGYFLDQMDKGVLRADDAHVAATMVVSLCVGGLRQRVLWGLSQYTAQEAAKEAAIVVDLFLRSYRRPEGRPPALTEKPPSSP